jgi:DNA polymerase III alpha subunit
VTASQAGAFAHLHLESQYSLLSALGSPKKIVARATELGMSWLTHTDEMNLFGAVEF